MNLIANVNYYQRKVWEQNLIELETKRKTARMTPAELEDEENRMNRCLERSFQKYEEHQTTMIYKPAFWRRWGFKRATEMALAVAKYFEFNVCIEANDIKGQIKMRGDSILLDASIWNDSKPKRQLLWLLRRVESIWIGVTEEYGVNLIDLGLTYKLVRECRKRKKESKCYSNWQSPWILMFENYP